MTKGNFLREQFDERKELAKQNAKNVAKRWAKDKVDTSVIRSNNDGTVPVYNIEEKREEERRREENSEDFFSTKEIAFSHLRDNDSYVEECLRILTNRGWTTADEIDVIAVLKNFITGKCDIDKPKTEIKQHFKNWLFREKIENLNTLSTVFKNGLNRKSA